MADRYTSFANSALGKNLVGSLGLPKPTMLERYSSGNPVIQGDILVGGSEGSVLLEAVTASLSGLGTKVFTYDKDRNLDEITAAFAKQQLKWFTWSEKEDEGRPFKGVVFDASGISRSEGLEDLYHFFHSCIRKIRSCGRIVVLGRIPEHCAEPEAWTAQRALVGFTKAIAKEVGKGGTAQLLQVADGAGNNVDSSLKFFLSPKSAYVSGQVVRIYPAGEGPAPLVWERPLEGRTALVTGSARGIGAAVAEVLARDGARVVCLDIPQASEELEAVASRIGGEALALDITAAEAPERLSAFFKHGLDILVHNAGITRDKTLGKMKEDLWKMVMNVNLSSEERINRRLLADGVLKNGSRIICVSSISGIAGNFGQTNYSTSKAGVIGLVESSAERLFEKGITINAVAPGFIETKMTDAMPFMIREAGRRMNAMSQGGQPVDVAETIAWFAQSASRGVNGNIVRVCGLGLIGA